MPVPQIAEVFERRSPAPTEESVIVYALPNTVDLIVLNTWYSKYLPIGQDWEEWKWCRIDLSGDENNIITRFYRHPTGGNLLSVSTAGQNTAAVVIISVDKREVPPC